jgi:uncharacterized protein YyaL (SSP411 family)
MRHLLQSFAGSLSAGLDAGLSAGLEADRHEPAAQAPFVYTTAISSNAGLVRSLAGITLIAREMGFEREAETLYSTDALSATYHAQHNQSSVALAVEVCPPRQTVSVAVSGSDNEETYRLFLDADARLFGNC